MHNVARCQPLRCGGREGWAIVSLSEQLYAFGLTIIGGIAMGVLFDLFRVVRRGVGSRRPLAVVLDLMYWVLATPMMLALLWRANHGELRFYVVLGVGVGSLLYNALVSPFVVEILSALWYGTGRILIGTVHALVFIVTWPILAVRNLSFALRGRGPLSGTRRPKGPLWPPALAWRRR